MDLYSVSLIFLFFIFSTNSDQGKEYSLTKFNELVRNTDDISKIEIIPNTHVANIYLTKEAERKQIHKDFQTQKVFLSQENYLTFQLNL